MVFLFWRQRGIRNATLATAAGGGNREQGLAPRSKSAAAKAATADFGYRKRNGRKLLFSQNQGRALFSIRNRSPTVLRSREENPFRDYGKNRTCGRCFSVYRKRNSRKL